MDAFQLLKADHREVAQLFEEMESTDGNGKLRVFEQIRTALELHTHIEETIFYPAVEQPKETHDLTLEAYEEHDVVKKLLQELSRSRTANDEWEAQAKVLRENVEHHVDEEENELFPKAADVLSEDEIEDLGDRMQTEKTRQQSRKGRGAGKAAKKGAKKAAGKSSKSRGGSKKSGTKKSSKKTSSKKSGGKKRGSKKSASASKGASRSTAAKSARKSGSKKSTAKKR